MVDIKNIYILNNFKFIVTSKNIINIDNSNKNITITVRSGNKKYVELTINKNEPKNASLDKFDYLQDCNISKDMMDKLILFLKNEIKTDMNIDIDTITLEDGSKRPCEGTKFNIMYYDLYLFKYGMPYYNYK